MFNWLLLTGKKLSDLERVTSLKVYNWFANRRKEMKRRANIGNIVLFPGKCCFSLCVVCVLPSDRIVQIYILL